jgi:hypothetical protein
MGACMLASLLAPHSAVAAGFAFASVIAGTGYLFAYSYIEYKKSGRA